MDRSQEDDEAAVGGHSFGLCDSNDDKTAWGSRISVVGTDQIAAFNGSSLIAIASCP